VNQNQRQNQKQEPEKQTLGDKPAQPSPTGNQRSEFNCGYAAYEHPASGEATSEPRLGGEWTLALSLIPDRDTRRAVEKAHKAELAAERENVRHFEAANKTLLELAQDDKQQLIAARAAIKPLVEVLKLYMALMDALYNHNEAVRQAVLQHFGEIHPKIVWDALAQAKEGK